MKPLRILQVTATYVGAEWFHDQVAGLARLGHTVHAVLPGDGPLAERLRAADIPVEIIPFKGQRPHQLLRVSAAEVRLLRLIRAFAPDVIHAHALKAALCCRLAALGHRPAVRVTQWPSIVHLYSRWLSWPDRCTVRLDDVQIGSCQAIAEQYRAMGARAATVNYYGCDVHRLDPETSGAGFRREYGLAGDTPTVGMVARIQSSRLRAFREIGIKGHEVFLDAAPLILDRMPAAQLFVVGDSIIGDTAYRRGLEARATALGVADRVHFIGWRSDLAPVLAGLDVAVNPSLQESACGTMVEALLMRKGVVASNVGGLPDTIQHGKTGLLVPPADPAALAAAVTELLTDPARRLEMGTLGREHCLRRFDIDTTVGQLENIYRRALRASKRAAEPMPIRTTP
jgi:glycosyltransferase involved in cell wall biosynthesis